MAAFSHAYQAEKYECSSLPSPSVGELQTFRIEKRKRYFSLFIHENENDGVGRQTRLQRFCCGRVCRL